MSQRVRATDVGYECDTRYVGADAPYTAHTLTDPEQVSFAAQCAKLADGKDVFVRMRLGAETATCGVFDAPPATLTPAPFYALTAERQEYLTADRGRMTDFLARHDVGAVCRPKK